MSAITEAIPSAALVNGGEIGGPFPGHPSAPGKSLIVEEFIAHVLRRAHDAALASDAPDEARTVLDVAHLFADELADIGRQLDRVRFIEAATQEPA
jgi:hypothetical protein